MELLIDTATIGHEYYSLSAQKYHSPLPGFCLIFRMHGERALVPGSACDWLCEEFG